MIITRILGGLGNQMFEYAMGMSIARKQNTTFKVNLRAFKETRIPYGLHYFSTTAKTANLLEILLVKKFTPEQYFDDFYWLNYNNWTSWMGEKNIIGIEDTIRKEFSLKKKFWEELDKKNHSIITDIQESNSVAIHLRRTDYFDKENCIVLEPEYYAKALDIISHNVKDPRYFFFSDDMEWVKNHFAYLKNSVFLSNKDYEDMALMSLCKHTIISNSTFAWWAAWLNKNPNKIVITPEHWFVNSYNVEGSLNLKDWTPVSNKKIHTSRTDEGL
jgi:hypothetical protein